MPNDDPQNSVALLYPQWQGAGNSPELFEGTVALWNFFSPKVHSIEIPVDRQRIVAQQSLFVGFEQIKEQLLKAYKLLHDVNPTRIVSIGGGCDVEVAIISHLRTVHDHFSILWFDAHGDLNTPESSPSHLFHGMALRYLLEGGKGFGFHLPMPSISSRNVALLGTRDLDPPEREYVARMDIPVISPIELKDSIPEKLDLRFRQSEKVYVHIDLDVIDPFEYPGVKCPTANGIKVDHLSSVLKDIMEHWKVIGLSFVENIEINQNKLSVLEPIIQLAREF